MKRSVYLLCYLSGETISDSENMKKTHSPSTVWTVELVSWPSTNLSVLKPQSHKLHFSLFSFIMKHNTRVAL